MAAGGIRAGKAFVELFTDNKRLIRGLKLAQARLRRFSRSVTSMGAAMAKAGTIGALPFIAATKVFAGFADKMSEVQAVTGATNAEFALLNETAKQLGSSTSFSASQAAEGMKFLGQAGFTTTQIIAGLPAVLNLARAGAIDLGLAADIASDVGSAFGLTADEIGRLADVMAVTAASANTSIELMGESFKFAAPLAKLAGQSIEDTAAAIGVLGNNAIKGSLAGTDLQLIFKKLAGSGGNALKEIGVEVETLEGSLRPIGDIMEDLGVKLEQFTDVEKIQILEKAFGRAAKSAAFLSSKTENFKELREAIAQSAGEAEKIAKTMDDNVGGAFRKLSSAIEGVAISIGEAIAPAIRQATGILTTFTAEFSAFAKKNKELVVAIAKVTAGLIAGGVALIALGGVASVAATALGVVAASITAAAATIGTLVTIATAVAPIIAAIGAPLAIVAAGVAAVTTAVAFGGAAWLVYSDDGRAAIKAITGLFASLKQTVMKTIGGITDALKGGDLQLAGEVAMAGLNVAWQQGISTIGGLWRDFTSSIERVWVDVWTSIKKTVFSSSDTIRGIIAGLMKTFAKFSSGTQGFFENVVIDVAEQSGILSPEIADATRKSLEDDRAKALKSSLADADDVARKRTEKELQEKLREIEVARDKSQRAIEEGVAADIVKAEKALEAAQKRLDDSIERARKSREEADAASAERAQKEKEQEQDDELIPQNNQLPEIPGLGEDIKERLGSLAATVQSLPGAFDRGSQEAARLFAGNQINTVERAAQAERQKQTKKLEEQLKKLNQIDKNLRQTQILKVASIG